MYLYNYYREHSEEERAFDCPALPVRARFQLEKMWHVQPETRLVELDSDSMWNKNMWTLKRNLGQILQQHIWNIEIRHLTAQHEMPVASTMSFISS